MISHAHDVARARSRARSLFGIGVGFASSQLTNVILSEVDREKAGVASGTNTTVRQVGAALGIAVIGSLLNAQAIRHAVRAVRASARIPAPAEAVDDRGHPRQGRELRARPRARPRAQAAALAHALQNSVVNGARPALLFAAGVVALGAFLSLLIPNYGPPPTSADAPRPNRGRAPSNPSPSRRVVTVLWTAHAGSVSWSVDPGVVAGGRGGSRRAPACSARPSANVAGGGSAGTGRPSMRSRNVVHRRV